MPPKKKLKEKALFIFAAAFLILISIILSYNRVFDVYELHTLDLRYRFRPGPKIDEKIVVVEISDDSIKKIGSWPFDRKYHALLAKALKYAKADTIIFDIFFSERKEDDDEFVKAVEEVDNVYMPYVFDIPQNLKDAAVPFAEDFEVKLLDNFSSACKGTGHINIIPDLDGKFRRVPPFIKLKDALYPHIGFLAAANFLGYSADSINLVPKKYILLDENFKIPVDANSNIIVNFPGRWVDTYRHYSYIDILTSYIAALEGKKGIINLDELENTICLVGLTATAEPDVHPSPYESLYPGLGVHASLFNSMISRQFIRRASKAINIFILFILAAATFVTTMRGKRFLSFVYIFIFLFSFFIVAALIFAFSGLWIDVFYPIVLSVLLYVGLTFNKYLVERRRIEILENELSIARDIQESFLPKAKPRIEGIAIEAKMLMARQVGGDLYDFVDISRKRAGIMIGDVSGKGVPAALYMAKVVSDFKSYAKEESASGALLRLNERLIQESSSNLFVTLSYLVFDMEKRTLNFSSGGHLPAIMLREGEESPRFLDLKEGIPLGLMEGSFSDDTIEIKKGDLFILYTDGVTEAMNAKGEMFDKERLVDIAKRYRDRPLKELVDSIHRDVRIYEAKLPQHDDITVVAVRVEE